MQTLLPSASSLDPTWEKVPSVIFAIIEINVGIACAAVVTLRPLYRRLRDASRDPSANPSSTINLNTSWRWRSSHRVGDSFDLISDERVQAGAIQSVDGKIELGKAAAPPPDRTRGSGSLTSAAANCR